MVVRRRKSETRIEGVSSIVAWREKELCPTKESVWFIESVYAGLRQSSLLPSLPYNEVCLTRSDSAFCEYV
jgi:hypothetical protein